MSHAPPPAPADTPELTVILPVFNEAPNLALLWPELIGILDAHWQRVEIIFVALPPYDGMHRFVPTLLRIAGYKVREVPVTHRPRRFGQSKFGVRNRAAGRSGIFSLCVGCSTACSGIRSSRMRSHASRRCLTARSPRTEPSRRNG